MMQGLVSYLSLLVSASLITRAHPHSGPEAYLAKSVQIRDAQDIPSKNLNTTSNNAAIIYEVPGTTTSLAIQLGISIPHATPLGTFLEYVINTVQVNIQRESAERKLLADRRDPLLIECTVGQQQFQFFVQSSTDDQQGSMTWGRAADMANGLKEVIIVQGRNRFARDVRVRDKGPDAVPQEKELGRGNVKAHLRRPDPENLVSPQADKKRCRLPEGASDIVISDMVTDSLTYTGTS